MSASPIINKISQLLSTNAWMFYFRFASGIQCGCWPLDDRTAAPSHFCAVTWSTRREVWSQQLLWLIANLRKVFLHAKLRHATLFLSIFKKRKEFSWRKHLALFLALELRITLENFENIRHLKYLSPNCLFLSDFRIWTDIFAWRYYLTFLGWNLFITVTFLRSFFLYFVFE